MRSLRVRTPNRPPDLLCLFIPYNPRDGVVRQGEGTAGFEFPTEMLDRSIRVCSLHHLTRVDVINRLRLYRALLCAFLQELEFGLWNVGSLHEELPCECGIAVIEI